MLCDYFLSSVTEGLQPNAEESGTGLQETSHGGFKQAHIQRCTHTHTHMNKVLLTEIWNNYFFYYFHLRVTVWAPVLLISIHMSWVCLKDLVNCHQSKGTACAFFFFSPSLSFLTSCLFGNEHKCLVLWGGHLLRINLCCVWGRLAINKACMSSLGSSEPLRS